MRCGFLKAVGRFSNCTAGSIITMTALLLPLIAATGMMSLDYAKAVSDKNRAQRAADAALLIGARSLAAAALQNSGLSEAAMKAQAVSVTTKAFDNAMRSFDVADQVSLNVDFTLQGSRVDAELDFVGRHDTVLGTLLPTSIFMDVDTKVSVPLRQRVEVHFVIDTSPSMNVGASYDDQTIMIDQSGCAFACHRGNESNYPDYLRAFGAKLRIDVVKDAIDTAINQLSRISRRDLEVYVAVHTFSNDAENPVPLTNDATAAATGLAAVEAVSSIWQGGTNYHASFEDIAELIARADRSPGAVLPEKRFVAIFTDGVADVLQWSVAEDGVQGQADHQFGQDPEFRTFEPRSGYLQGLDPLACDVFRRLHNTEVVGMNLVYLPVRRAPGDAPTANDTFIANTLAPNADENMRRCAGNGRTYRADNEARVRESMHQLTDDLISDLGLRITE